MIIVELNKDIREYKEKLIGPFSARETGCLIAGVGLSFLLKSILFPSMSLLSTEMGYITLLCMIPFAIFGWAKVYGLYIEKFFKIALVTLLAPKTRYYDNGLVVPRKNIKVKKSKDPKLQRIS